MYAAEAAAHDPALSLVVETNRGDFMACLSPASGWSVVKHYSTSKTAHAGVRSVHLVPRVCDSSPTTQNNQSHDFSTIMIIPSSSTQNVSKYDRVDLSKRTYLISLR